MSANLLLLHAFPLDARMWAETQSAITDGRRIVAPSAGDLLSEGPSITSMARIAHALMGPDPYIPVGVSMGGYIALEIARQFPGQIAGLVLCDTRASGDSLEARTGRNTLIMEIEARGVVHATAPMVSRLVAPGASPEVKETIRAIVADQTPHVVSECLLAMRDRPDNTGLLPDIAVPTLVIGGEEDALIPKEEMLGMAEAIPNGRFISLLDCGHLPPLERPHEFNEILLEFLD